MITHVGGASTSTQQRQSDAFLREHYRETTNYVTQSPSTGRVNRVNMAISELNPTVFARCLQKAMSYVTTSSVNVWFELGYLLSYQATPDEEKTYKYWWPGRNSSIFNYSTRIDFTNPDSIAKVKSAFDHRYPTMTERFAREDDGGPSGFVFERFTNMSVMISS
jgi:hypothetical protein